MILLLNILYYNSSRDSIPLVALSPFAWPVRYKIENMLQTLCYEITGQD